MILLYRYREHKNSCLVSYLTIFQFQRILKIVAMSNSDDRNKVKVAVDLLKGLQNNHPHNDVKIILDDGEIEASKFVLAARSEYFKKMFNDAHRFKESQENAVTIPYKRIVMNKVIEYLYVDGLALVEVFEYLDLLRLMMLEEAFAGLPLKKETLKSHF